MGSVGLGTECECKNFAHNIGTTMLFKHIHSGDINQSLKNDGCTHISR